MCGIVAGNDQNYTTEKIEYALQAIRKRGPDSSTIVKINATSFMGFNLLGLSSLQASRLSQPFINEKKTLFVCVNGEIYNSPLLRSDLENKGYKFKTDSDCEVALYGLEHYGASFLSQLNGEFALVAHFADSNHWLCAVDHVGTKPLKYFLTSEKFLIASSALALKNLGVALKLDPNACLFTFHNACPPLGQSLFTQVSTIPPGHYLIVDDKRHGQILPYAAAPAAPSSDGSIEELLDQAVRTRIPQHYKPAVALSGGLDSRAIAFLLKRANISFDCFSLDFPQSDFSELKEIQEFCQSNSLSTTLVTATESELIRQFPKSILNAENIAINPHTAAKLLLNEAIVAAGHRVCFTGDGADELFWGYEHFHTNDEFQFIRDANFIGAQFSQILKPEFRGKLLTTNLFQDFQAISTNPTAQELYYNYWLNEYGLKILGDSQSANVSLEYRHPFVDLRLINSLKNGGNSKTINSPSKMLLRKALEKINFQQAYLAKKAFTAPRITHNWLPLFEQFVFTQQFESITIFDHEKTKNYVTRLSQHHLPDFPKASSVLLCQILSLAILNQELCHA